MWWRVWNENDFINRSQDRLVGNDCHNKLLADDSTYAHTMFSTNLYYYDSWPSDKIKWALNMKKKNLNKTAIYKHC